MTVRDKNSPVKFWRTAEFTIYGVDGVYAPL